MDAINRNQSTKTVHTVLCLTTDASNSDYVRIITTLKTRPVIRTMLPKLTRLMVLPIKEPGKQAWREDSGCCGGSLIFLCRGTDFYTLLCVHACVCVCVCVCTHGCVYVHTCMCTQVKTGVLPQELGSLTCTWGLPIRLIGLANDL